MKITKTMSLWNWTLKTKNKNPSLYAGVALKQPYFFAKKPIIHNFCGIPGSNNILSGLHPESLESADKILGYF